MEVKGMEKTTEINELKSEKMKELQTDIAIIGGGPGGLAAALQAAQLGVTSIVLDKRDRLGGVMMGGTGPFAAGTIQQRRERKTLTPEDAFEFFMNFTHWQTDPGLVAAFVGKSAETIQWLEALGCSFEHVVCYIDGGYHTWHENDMSKGFITDHLWAAAKALGVTAMTKTKATKILMKDGRAVGVCAVDDAGVQYRIRSKAVIVSTGGFGSNPEMVKKYTKYELGKNLVCGSTLTDGDGLKMMWEAGAAKDRMMMDAHVSLIDPKLAGAAGVSNDFDAFKQPNLMVNQSGKRFTNEAVMHNGAYAINIVSQQEDLCGYMILTDEIVAKYKKEGMPILLPLKPPFQNEYADWPKNFEKSLAEVVDRSDDVFEADTIRELALSAGIDPGQLEDTVREYNEICDQKQDRQFFKKPEYLLPIRGKKYYMARYRASSFCSLGGVKIDKNASVLDTRQAVIPGLYAAGNDACSICLDTYSFFTAGLTSSFALNMGRIAAQSAVGFIKKAR